ncbi:LysE family translocator [Glycomyces harbinensis]|uniref:Resistance to homoserine/threonine (RhtB) family protein n=1 Tax=Glycomyces harbinensis TaxID=58114 RepID=A0A1G6TJB5_9ACTN|nr:LysE family translocator [Glycomyces harbinensis]SDD29131.1 resistance to homoserine/threonine (RhtB) family protein [Glycomyces harbinensis]
MTVLLIFGLAILIAAIVPGPDFAMVVRNTVMSGRASGMWTAAGVGFGVCVWVVTTSVGLAALLAASALAFTVVKIAGAAYLVYLGIRSIRTAIKERRTPAAEIELDRAMTRLAAFRSGLMCNLLNPKAVVLFTALMPQFIDGGADTQWVLIGELAAVGMTVVSLWYLALAGLIGLLRRVLDRPRVRAWINGVTGAVMVALGLRVAVS